MAATSILDDLAALGGDSLAALRALPAHAAMDDASVETFYVLAANALALGQAERANLLFNLLAGVRPSDPRFLAGLGHSLRALGDLRGAVLFLSMAVGLEGDSGASALAVAEVLIELGERSAARLVLAAIEARCAGQPAMAADGSRAAALRQVLVNG